MRELQRKMDEGCDVYITPDGPKGPRYTVSAGALWLAQQSGAGVMPVSVEVSRCWRLGRWDGFRHSETVCGGACDPAQPVRRGADRR